MIARGSLAWTWLTRLRWAAWLGQAGAIALARLTFSLPLPYATLTALLAVLATSNLVIERLRPPERWLPAVVLGDMLVLTLLLALTGGPSNPFTALYLVHVALAAVALGPRWTVTAAVLSAVCFGALFLVSDPHLLHRGGPEAMTAHLVGMWAALTTTGAAIAAFVAQLAAQVRAREDALILERTRVERAQQLAALGALAAGAAHELGSPLGAIALAAEEGSRCADPSVAEEFGFIAAQVARCRDALGDLGSTVGTPRAEPAEAVTIEALLHRVRAVLPRLKVQLHGGELHVHVPPRAMTRTLLALLDNARRAAPEGVVHVSAGTEGERVTLNVDDEGAGVPVEILARLGEPFVTTRAPGDGMGLGVYAAKALVESLGGSFAVQPRHPNGTRVKLVLPRAA